MFPQLLRYQNIGILLLRLMAGVIFISSGWSHVKHPAEKSKSIGITKGFTSFLEVAEIAGSLGIIFGVLSQIAALGLIVLMLGAIQKKIATWHSGFGAKMDMAGITI
jgi:putative oxidoreductase